ncbi:MAG: glycosyltransferase [Candidatus Omnitrophota bacterium]|jgi:glycosyltransferase involved in cell wall biosynthesis
MKVAFFAYPSSFQNKGGGEILLEKTEEYLRKKGVTVKRFDMWNDKLDDFDVLHIFGSVKECLGLMKTARAKGVKVALASIFWSDFCRAFYEEGPPAKKAEMVIRHAMKIVFPFFPSPRRSMFRTADIVFPNSEGEARQISRLFSIPIEKMFVVPNGVDRKYADGSSGLFLEKYGLKDFVLSVGRIEPRKNQLNLIRAMKGVDRDLVLIGEPVSGYEWYYDKCLKEAGENVRFLGHMPNDSELLMSAYASCEVFVLPGWFETPGLAALEAALAGAKIVATRGGSTKEYFNDMVLYIRPNAPEDMRLNIKKALGEDKTDKLKRFVLDYYTWEKVAEKNIEGYKTVMGK